MARILVTGGCGFIGSHTIDALIARGDQPIILDDLSTGKRGNIPTNVPIIEGSILDGTLLNQAMKGVEAVIHLAAISSVQKCNEQWAESHSINLSGTIRVFEAAHQHGNIPVIYASSAAVYGMVSKIPISELDPVCPLTAYGADKYGCELHAQVAGRIHGVPTVGLRFFNVYGRRQDPRSPYSGVISIFAKKIKENAALTISGDGQQKRDFIHVSDVVDHLLAALEQAEIKAPVLNVCTGTATTISQLARMLEKISGSKSAILNGPPREGDIRLSVGDPTEAIKKLNVKYKIGLEKGLSDLLEYFS